MNALLLLLCLGMLGLFVLIVGIIVIVRYFNSRDTMTQAGQGRSSSEIKNTRTLLRWGIVITVFGLLLTLLLYPIGFLTGSTYPLQLGPWMLGGLVPLFLGLGLILLHYLFIKE